MIRQARKIYGIGLHVIIRSRGGDFLFDDDEMAIMRFDVEIAKEEGAHGVVIGLLTREGDVDAARTRELIALARPLSVTFHRAFDWKPAQRHGSKPRPETASFVVSSSSSTPRKAGAGSSGSSPASRLARKDQTRASLSPT
jgi:hypothetical protein